MGFVWRELAGPARLSRVGGGDGLDRSREGKWEKG